MGCGPSKDTASKDAVRLTFDSLGGTTAAATSQLHPAKQNEVEQRAIAARRNSEAAAKRAALPAVANGLARYVETGAIFDALNEEDVALYSLKWILEHAATGRAMPRRQEMPQEAVLSRERIEAIWNAAPEHVREAVLPIVSISYCWLEKEHPDRDGEQLRHIASIMQQEWSSEWSRRFEDMAVFWDWPSIYQEEGGGTRSSEQYTSFKRALNKTMDLWYAHQGVVVLFVTKLAEHKSAEVRSYDSRGWTSFERCSAELIKPLRPLVAPQGVDMSKGEWLWDMCIDTARYGKTNAGRRLPTAPEQFAHELEGKIFTNDADHVVVAGLYRQAAEKVMAGIKKMTICQMEFGGGGGKQLGRAIALCQALEELYLSHGIGLTAEELSDLFEMSEGGLHCLHKLYLDQSRLGDREAAVVARAIEDGHVPSLRWLDFTNEMGPSPIGDEGTVAVARAIGTGALPYLSSIYLKTNPIADAGLVALAAAFAEGATPVLKELSLEGCRVGDEGITAFARVVRDGHLPELSEFLVGCNVSDVGAKAFAAAIAAGACPEFVWLDFRANPQLGDEGCIALADAVALRSTKMATFVLSDTGVKPTDAVKASFKKCKAAIAASGGRLYCPFAV